MAEVKQRPKKAFTWSADLEVGIAVAGANVPVKVTARSGNPIDHWYWGAIVHDFAGMIVDKGKIALDYNHWTEIGYLDTFDVSTGDLVCTGAIVPVANDDSSIVLAKMQGGVPYQASIEFDSDGDLLMEFIPEGFTAQVNGRTIVGPVTVVRQWELLAVAICKLGADDDTAAELEFTKEKNPKNNSGFFVRVSKYKAGDKLMAENKKPEETPAKPTPTAPAEEPKKIDAVPAPATPAPVQLAKPVADGEKNREEFKRFVGEFGGEKAAEYFSEGLEFGAAVLKHMAFQRKEIESLKTKLSSVDRGEEKPVKFSKSNDPGEKRGMLAVISRQK